MVNLIGDYGQEKAKKSLFGAHCRTHSPEGRLPDAVEVGGGPEVNAVVGYGRPVFRNEKRAIFRHPNLRWRESVSQRLRSGLTALIVDSCERQDALQDRAQADQNDQQFEKIGEPAVIGKLVDGPKTDRPDDNDNEHADQR